METRKGEVITRREIDAMGEEELLGLVRRHAKLLGERFPKRMDRFYCPDILDESHLPAVGRAEMTKRRSPQSCFQLIGGFHFWGESPLNKSSLARKTIQLKSKELSPYVYC